MRVTIACFASALTWMVAVRALACGSAPPAYLTVLSVSPSDGAVGFLRNGAVRVELKSWPVQGDGRGTTVRVTLVNDGSEVEGTLDDTFASSPNLVWAPRGLLAANTQYRIEVTTAAAPNADADGPISSITTFTTGDVIAPVVRLTSDLKIQLRVGSVPHVLYSTCNDCGTNCTVDGEQPALFAEVDLPSVSGGFDAYGYRGWLALTNDAPRAFDGPGEGRLTASELVNILQYVRLDAPGSGHVTLQIPLEDRSYSPCFAFNVWDASGQAASDLLCLPAADVDGLAAALSTGKVDAGVGDSGMADVGRVTGARDAALDVASDGGRGRPDAGAGDAPLQRTSPSTRLQRVNGDARGCSSLPRAKPTHAYSSLLLAVIAVIGIRVRRRH